MSDDRIDRRFVWSQAEIEHLEAIIEANPVGRALITEVQQLFGQGRQRVEPVPRRRKVKEHPGFVYFIEAVGAGRIKIGWAKRDVEQRLRYLHTSCPYELRLLGSMVGSRRAEYEMHCRFASARVFSNKEWFADSPALRGFIEANCTRDEQQ